MLGEATAKQMKAAKSVILIVWLLCSANSTMSHQLSNMGFIVTSCELNICFDMIISIGRSRESFQRYVISGHCFVGKLSCVRTVMVI